MALAGRKLRLSGEMTQAGQSNYTLFILKAIKMAITSLVNSINWTSMAAKQLRKLDQQAQLPIRNAVTKLTTMPNCQNVKRQ